MEDAGGCDAGALSTVLTLTRHAPSGTPVSSQLRSQVGEAVARLTAGDDAVGASIEDHAAACGTDELYNRVLATERIEAATTAASLPFPVTLTARAECCLVGHPNPFGESVARATSCREAGADCLHVPGIADAETIGRLVKEVGAPVNVVMGLAGSPMSVNQLEDLGMKRVSIGGSLVLRSAILSAPESGGPGASWPAYSRAG